MPAPTACRLSANIARPAPTASPTNAIPAAPACNGHPPTSGCWCAGNSPKTCAASSCAANIRPTAAHCACWKTKPAACCARIRLPLMPSSPCPFPSNACASAATTRPFTRRVPPPAWRPAHRRRRICQSRARAAIEPAHPRRQTAQHPWRLCRVRRPAATPAAG